MTVTLPRALQQRYRVERELGRGGMGAVYLATDLSLDRLVALKVLPPEYVGDAGLRERFLRETRTAASFSHPNIVPVHHVEEDAGSLAFVMGYVEGESVAGRVARTGPLDVRSTVRMLQDVAYALAYAHGRGVVHRDIKPDNIMIERATGRALVMDFGISRSITPRADAPGLTRVGEVVGTPEYMSPEQASGDNVDGRSDLYSLGLVALFALTGTPPITGETTQQIIVKQLTERLPRAASLRGDLPAALADAIDRCVGKEPGERFATAEALVEAIDNAKLSGPEIPLPVRLFAQEAATLGLIMAFTGIISVVLIVARSDTASGVDALLPVTMLAGVVLTRVLQTRAEAGRLARAGFAVGDVLAGMSAVLDERSVSRASVATDPVIRGKRKRTLVTAWLQMPLAVLLFRLALQTRVQTGPSSYRIGIAGTTLVFSAFALAGVSLVLILRSPFRAPIGERLFRLVWLGSFGRAFLRGAMKQKGGDAPQPRTSPGNARHAAPGPATPATPAIRATAPRASTGATGGATGGAAEARSSDERLDRIEALLEVISRRIGRG